MHARVSGVHASHRYICALLLIFIHLYPTHLYTVSVFWFLTENEEYNMGRQGCPLLRNHMEEDFVGASNRYDIAKVDPLFVYHCDISGITFQEFSLPVIGSKKITIEEPNSCPLHEQLI